MKRKIVANPIAEEPHRFSKIAEELVGELRGGSPDDPPRSKRRATQSLATLVEQLMLQHQIGRASPEQAIRDQWVELVGAANAAYSHPAKLERGKLTVLAAHSVVRNELFLHRAEIVERIRKLPGCEAIKALNLRAG
jgi:hypothetical protein